METDQIFEHWQGCLPISLYSHKKYEQTVEWAVRTLCFPLAKSAFFPHKGRVKQSHSFGKSTWCVLCQEILVCSSPFNHVNVAVAGLLHKDKPQQPRRHLSFLPDQALEWKINYHRFLELSASYLYLQRP